MTNRTAGDAKEPGLTEHAEVLMRALARLRDLHEDMTLLQAMTFLCVAANPGIQQRGLYDKLDMEDSSASRTLALLSDVGARGFAGLDLIKAKIDPQDRRMRLLSLTPKGARLMDDLAKTLGARSAES